ncbi:carboxymuconolactone decarboxylase family protein [Arthrobacter sp. I2-34]|uniref:Carboxymuconolactone decarboxylase family protein n=1 Tax=Arthrobacter hankyongi TaxID=2904801 RepID=A0ABS9LAF6_9MICC|nr:carboxymuconolactone decarboxylase family protein [Arthrobacter hankyongi]MCG2623671.1 carboxymuconolactone decarboxylase family protein [Arthrobacter hankyongi]
MPRIPVHTPEESRAHVARPERKTGRLLNIHAEVAHCPVVIAAYRGISQAIAEHGTFDARTRKAIVPAVGNQNGRDYCRAAYTLSARKADLTNEQILTVCAGEVGFDDRLAAITEVARAADTGNVPEVVWQAALDAGWSDTELAEAFAHLADNLYTDYISHYAHTEPDLPAAEPLSA